MVKIASFPYKAPLGVTLRKNYRNCNSGHIVKYINNVVPEFTLTKEGELYSWNVFLLP